LDGSDPLFSNGWRGWPQEAKQDDVLSWFADFTEKLAAFAEIYNSAPAPKPRPLAKPDELIAGSVGKWKMDIGFVDDPSARKTSGEFATCAELCLGCPESLVLTGRRPHQRALVSLAGDMVCGGGGGGGG
jgi:hypothetical protein